MKKTAKTIIITLIALMIMTIAASPVNAAGGVKSVSLNKTSATMNVGSGLGLQISFTKTKGYTVNTKNIQWASSNSAVAAVSGGYITAKKAGTATITATLEGHKATCKVTVKAVKPTWVNTSGAYTELNKYRKNAKLKALKKDAKLEAIAKTRAKEMAEKNKFSHTRPNGKSGLTLIPGNVYKGENIAKGQTSAAAVTKAWYNSKGHRANMLAGNKASKHFTKVGIACYKYNGVTYWAQVFSS